MTVDAYSTTQRTTLLLCVLVLVGCGTPEVSPVQRRTSTFCQTLRSELTYALEAAESARDHPELLESSTCGGQSGTQHSDPVTDVSGAGSRAPGEQAGVSPYPAWWGLELYALAMPLSTSVHRCILARALPDFVYHRLDQGTAWNVTAISMFATGQSGRAGLVEPLRELIDALAELEGYPLRR